MSSSAASTSSQSDSSINSSMTDSSSQGSLSSLNQSSSLSERSSSIAESSSEAQSSSSDASSSSHMPISSSSMAASSSSTNSSLARCGNDVEMGETLYLINCQFCHGNVPQDGRIVWQGNAALMDIFDQGQDGFLTGTTPESVNSLALHDFIQAYMPSTLSNIPYSEIDSLLAYITHTLNIGQDWCPGDAWPPTPSQSNSSEATSSNSITSSASSAAQTSSISTVSSDSASSSDQAANPIGPEGKVVLANKGETTGSIEIVNDQARMLIDEQTVITVEARGFDWSEGPAWSEAGEFLLFSDVPQNVMYRFHPAEGISVYLEPSGATGYYPAGSSQGSNGLAFNAAGELIIMQTGDRRVAKMVAPLSEPSQQFETLVSHYNGARLNAPNDLVIHSSGDIYFTDPRFGSRGESGPGFTGVYRLTSDGDITLLDRMQSNPNGIGLSPDESKLYIGGGGNIIEYDLSADGEVSNKSILRRIGRVDGLDVHSSGVIFTTSSDGVSLISPQGELLADIITGRTGPSGLSGSTGNCTFSADEKTLYITADDRLLSVKIK